MDNRTKFIQVPINDSLKFAKILKCTKRKVDINQYLI